MRRTSLGLSRTVTARVGWRVPSTRLGLLALCGLVAASCAPEPATPFLERATLFAGGDGGYTFFRIPSLVETAEGTLLAFAEGRRSLSDTGDIDLVLRRSVDGGRTFSPLVVVVDVGPDTAGNPAPVVDRRTGEVLLVYCTNPAADDQDRHVFVARSADDGLSFGAPTEITADVKPAGVGWYATGPGRSVQLASGRIVVPCDQALLATGEMRGCVAISDDGVHFRPGGSVGPELDESQVAELSDGTVLLASRDESTRRRRAFARSTDGGETFGPVVYEPTIPDPHCQGSLLATPEGLLHSNPASDAYGSRNHLTVRRSDDDGATWPIAKLFEAGPSAYSSLARTPDGTLHMLFEVGEYIPYERIDVVRFSASYLETPDAP